MDREKTAQDLERLLRLRTRPVGVRLCPRADELGGAKIPSAPVSLCQMVKGAAQAGWTLACPPDRMGCLTAQMILGFREPGEKDVQHHLAQFAAGVETARALMEIKPKLKVGEVEGIRVAPLESWGQGMDPQLAMVLVDPHQAMILIQAYAFSRGEALQFTNGVSSAVCSYGAVQVYRSQRPNLVVPCVGSRRYGQMQDHELVFSLPISMVEEMVANMRQMVEAGKFPLPLVGGFLSPTVPVNYLVQ